MAADNGKAPQILTHRVLVLSAQRHKLPSAQAHPSDEEDPVRASVGKQREKLGGSKVLGCYIKFKNDTCTQYLC